MLGKALGRPSRLDSSFPYPLLQPHPQNRALSQMLKLSQPNEQYLYLHDGERGELVGLLNPEIPLLMQKRLELFRLSNPIGGRLWA